MHYACFGSTQVPLEQLPGAGSVHHFLRSANNVYYLDGKVIQMYMFVETADINSVCKLACYDWIIYFAGTVLHPNEPLHLRKCLGPVIDVGPAMTEKILQHNGKVV